MDIAILEFLEMIREACGGVFNTFFYNALPQLTEDVFMHLPIMFTYWCLNKECGELMGLSLGMGSSVNIFLKNIFKVPRPYNRPEGANLHPLGTMSSYSFPSGHTTRATAIYGSSGWFAHKLNAKTLRNLLWSIVGLIMLARMMAGVHTPQDVLAGLISTALIVGLVLYIQKWADTKSKVLFVGLGTVLFSLATGFFLGEWHSMLGDGIGLTLGWMLERLFVNFDLDVPVTDKIVRFVSGVLGFLAIHYIVGSALPLWLDAKVAGVITTTLTGLYVMFIHPYFFNKWETNR